MVDYAHARRPPPGGGHRRRPARSGGRPRPAEPRPRGRRRARRHAPDERPARPRRRRDPAARAWSSSASASSPGTRTTAIMGDRTRSAASGCATRPTIDCDLVVVAAGIRPNTDLARDQRLHRRAGHRRRRPDAHRRRRRRLRRRRVRAAPRRGLRPGRAAVGAGRGAGRPDHRRRPGRRVPRLADRDQAQGGRGRRRRRWASPSRSGTTDEHIVFSEPGKGVYKSMVIRDDKLIGATLLGDSRKVAFLQQAFDRGLPLPEERVELLFDLGGPAGGGRASPSWPTTPRSATATASPRATSVGAVEGGCKTVAAVMDKTRAGKGCGSCKTLVGQIVEWAAGGAVEEDPSAHWYVPGIPMDKPALMAAIREQDLRSASAVFAALAPEGAEDAKSKMGLASLLKMMWGEDVRRREGRPVHQRPGARQHPEGRHLLGRPADEGRRHHPGPAAPDRRRRREVRRADGEAHRRPADRPARHPQGGPARRLGRPRHAVGLRVRQVLPHREDLRRAGVLPVRHRRLHQARASRSRPGSRAWSARPR